MSFRNTVVLTTWERVSPACARIAFKFSSTRSVCCATSPSRNVFVFGSSAICAEKRNPFARTACEYGPIGFGALSVTIMSFMAWSSSWMERKNSTRYQHGGIFISSVCLLGELGERLGSVLSFGEGDDTPAIMVTMRDVPCSMARLGEAPKLLLL